MSVAARSSRFDPDDDRWLSQVRILHQGLAKEAELLTRRPVDAPGTKGGGLPDVAVLLSSNVLTAVTTAFVAWLSRDRDRSIDLAWNVNGRQGKFTATGKGVDSATLQAALEHGVRAAIGPESEDPAPPGGDPGTDGNSGG